MDDDDVATVEQAFKTVTDGLRDRGVMLEDIARGFAREYWRVLDLGDAVGVDLLITITDEDQVQRHKRLEELANEVGLPEGTA